MDEFGSDQQITDEHTCHKATAEEGLLLAGRPGKQGGVQKLCSSRWVHASSLLPHCAEPGLISGGGATQEEGVPHHGLVCVGGHPLGLPEAGRPVPAVPAGETVDISVKLTAPPYPGRNVGYYRLVTADGTRFGHRLWCDLVVDNSNVASVLKALRESGALPGSTSVVTQTSPRAEAGEAAAAATPAASAPGTPEEQEGYVVVPTADKLPSDGKDKRVSLRARARGRSGTGSSVATFDGAQGSASMEASMSDCGTPGAEAHRDTPALDAATPVTESALAQPATAEPEQPAAAADAAGAASGAADGDVPAHMAQYAVQLRSMRELGFADDAAYDALVASKGNVSAAVQALCGE